MIELLPIVGDKIIYPDVESNDAIIIVRKGNTQKLLSVEKSGWLTGGYIYFIGSRNTLFTIKYRTPTKDVDFSISPESLRESKFDKLEPLKGAVVSKFNEVSGEFTISWSPMKPVPFIASKSSPLELSVSAVDSDVTVISYLYNVYYIQEDNVRRVLSQNDGLISEIIKDIIDIICPR